MLPRYIRFGWNIVSAAILSVGAPGCHQATPHRDGDVTQVDDGKRRSNSGVAQQPSCEEYPKGRKGRHKPSSAVDAHMKEFELFLSRLQTAVAKDDAVELADLMEFPIRGLERQNFIAQYASIVNSCIKEAIRCTTIDNVAEDYRGAWLARDEVLVEFSQGRFLITELPSEGPCNTPVH